MTLKKFVIVTLISGLVMWIVAGLWHNAIMPSLYAQTHASHDGIGVLFVAYLLLAALMVHLYPRTHDARPPAWRGLMFGAVIGILWVFPHDLAMVGAHGLTLPYALKNGAWHMVEQGIGGLVMGLLVGAIPLSRRSDQGEV